MDKKLLVTDYDNTLELHYNFTNNSAILKRNIRALNKFRKHNIVCIATGRHFDSIYPTLIKNNVKFDYLCTNNGGELYNKNYKLLFCIPIDKKDLGILKKLTDKVFFRTTFNGDFVVSANIYINDINKYDNLRNFLDFNLTCSFVEYKFPKIKIINKKCDKSNIINIIKKNEKVFDNNIYTIGDDINDLNMILSYNGYTLFTANKIIKKIALQCFDELNELIHYIDLK